MSKPKSDYEKWVEEIKENVANIFRGFWLQSKPKKGRKGESHKKHYVNNVR